jgi:hypothetical protein
MKTLQTHRVRSWPSAGRAPVCTDSDFLPLLLCHFNLFVRILLRGGLEICFSKTLNLHQVVSSLDCFLFTRTVRGLSGRRDSDQQEFVKVSTRSSHAAVFWAYEQVDGCARAWLGPQRPFVYSVESPTDAAVALRISRPYRCWRTEAEIRDGNDELLGSIWQFCTACEHTMLIRDACHKPVLFLRGSWLVSFSFSFPFVWYLPLCCVVVHRSRFTCCWPRLQARRFLPSAPHSLRPRNLRWDRCSRVRSVAKTKTECRRAHSGYLRFQDPQLRSAVHFACRVQVRPRSLFRLLFAFC